MTWILFVGLGVSARACASKTDLLGAAWSERTRIFAAHTTQDQLCNIPKVKPDAPPIRAAVLSNLVPNNVRLVPEAPCSPSLQALQAALHSGTRDRDAPYLRRSRRPGELRFHGASSCRSATASCCSGATFPVLFVNCHGRVRENGREPPARCKPKQIGARIPQVRRS